jgi:hypothetical protein
MPAERLQRDDDRRLNLDQQKTRAKELRNDVRRGDATALARLRRHHPRAHDLADASIQTGLARLSDAQLVIAREIGLASWPLLKAHIEHLDRARRAIAAKLPAPDAGPSTLHSRCGSDIRRGLTDAGFIGDFLEFGDPLWLGPLPRAGDDIPLRARVIAEACEIAPAPVAAQLQESYDGLRKAADRYERIVLWCEHDCYDQLYLARALAEFASRPRLPIIELIAIDRFPAIEKFIGLGQLSPEALRLLWESRVPLTDAQFRLGTAVWHALRDPVPSALGALAASGTPELAIMAPALTRHLQELPWTGDGLSLTQRLALHALASGPLTVSQLFGATQRGTEPLAFMGDLFFWTTLREMLRAGSPPFVVDDDTAQQRWPEKRLSLTPAGEKLLSGASDWMSLRPLERWVGGVRVAAGADPWRWSAESHRPVRA